VRRSLCVAVIATAAALAGAVAAQAPSPAPAAERASAQLGAGDLNLTPRRLILSGRQRSGEVIVFNRGTGRAVYRVELQDLAMTPTGGLEPLDRVDAEIRARHRSAREIIRYSPRRIELEPGQSQVVRVLARAPAGAEASELRAHMVVSVVPPEGAGLDVAEAVNPTLGRCASASRRSSASPSPSSPAQATRKRR
jgi:P pilus assembly chaperone PapD